MRPDLELLDPVDGGQRGAEGAGGGGGDADAARSLVHQLAEGVGCALGDEAAVDQHRDAVGEAEHLVKPVCDVNDPDTIGPKPFGYREQMVNLAVC